MNQPIQQGQTMQPQPQAQPLDSEMQSLGMGNSQDTTATPDMSSNLDQHLGSLNDTEKAFVTEHLTPEIAVLVGLITGNQEDTQYLLTIADPSKVLIPAPRKEVLHALAEEMQGKGLPSNEDSTNTKELPLDTLR